MKSSRQLFANPFIVQGTFFLLYCAMVLVSFCAYAVESIFWVRAANLLFFFYFLVAWMFVDPVVIWAFAVSAIIYYILVPGVSLTHGILLFFFMLLLTYINDLRKRTLTLYDEWRIRLNRRIREKQRRIDHDNLQVERIYRKITRLGWLKRMSETISGNLDENHICRQVVTFCDIIIGKGSSIRLFMIGENLFTLTLKFEHCRDESHFSPSGTDAVNRWVLQHSQSMLVTDTHNDDRFFDGITSTAIRSIIAAPLITRDRIIGVLRIDSPQPHTFELADQRTLADIATLAALVISNARLFALTRELAVTDGLTGLLTQKAGKDILQSFIDAQKQFSILFIDIDDFKKINDTYGHIIGDQVLVHLTGLIRAAVPDGAACIRYGGEEFVVILEQHDSTNARHIAQGMRASVEQSSFCVRRTSIRLTVSIGIAVHTAQTDSADLLLCAADHALYRAKEQGKNRVVTA